LWGRPPACGGPERIRTPDLSGRWWVGSAHHIPWDGLHPGQDALDNN
jgi:hypothetical protein